MVPLSPTGTDSPLSPKETDNPLSPKGTDGPLSPKGTDGPLSPKGTVFLSIHFFKMIPCHSKSSRQKRFLRDLDLPIETE